METLVRPDKALADAVRVRQEVDLRIGASFTRFQTLLLRDALSGKQGVISYGPCQFPTLGFIVDRHQKIRDFKAEKFWSIELLYKSPENESVKLNWDRGRVFDKLTCLILMEKC